MIVPAALAVAEKTGASPPEFLRACLAGVEAACRTGMWLGRTHYRKGFHPTATAGMFGATMAAVRLLHADIDCAMHATGLAATRASGLTCQFGTQGKPYNAGMAAAGAVEAALLGAGGFVSCQQALEGPGGFAATHGGECNARAFAHMGEKFVFEKVQHKFHACCHGTHATLEALMRLREAHNLAPEVIHAVHITVNPCWQNVCNIAQPVTGAQTKFSLRFTAALTLLCYDTAAPDTFSAAACRDPALVAMRDKVTVEFDAGIAETAACVQVVRNGLSAVEITHDLLTPLPFATRRQRVQDKIVSSTGEKRAGALWSCVHDENHLISRWLTNITDV